MPSYIARVVKDWRGDASRLPTIHLDAGNSVAGPIVCAVLDALNIAYIPHYCDPDGDFPNHHPDPSNPENLQDLIGFLQVERAEEAIGIAYDGDGDRVGVIDEERNIIPSDLLLMYLCAPLLQEHDGATIVFDVKCSYLLPEFITTNGGRALMERTGHSFMKRAVKKANAVLGGEFSGHIFYCDRWYGFDDAVYTTVRLLEILSLSESNLSHFFSEIKHTRSTNEINIDLPDGANKWDIVAALKHNLTDVQSQSDFQLISIDGVRVQNKHGWGLIRCSNTTDVLVARFEADNKENLLNIHDLIQQQLYSINSELKVNLGKLN